MKLTTKSIGELQGIASELYESAVRDDMYCTNYVLMTATLDQIHKFTQALAAYKTTGRDLVVFNRLIELTYHLLALSHAIARDMNPAKRTNNNEHV